MTNSLARFISYLFNPILLLLFVPFFLLLRQDSNITHALYWTGYTLIFLLGITAFLAYGVRKKIFTDMDVSKRTQRPLLFLIAMVLGMIYLLGLFLLHGPQVLIIITIGIMLGIVVISIINLRIKASIHVASMSALIFALAVTYGKYYLLTLLMIPLIAWARVKIKRHTLPETIVGGILGILLSAGIYALTRVF